MRSQLWILGIVLGCGALLLALWIQRPAVRAQREGALVRNGSEEDAARDLSPSERTPPGLTPPGLTVPELPSAQEAPASGMREEVDLGRAAAALALDPARAADLLAELERARASGLLSDLRLAEFLAQVYLEHDDPRGALEILRAHGSTNLKLWLSVSQRFAAHDDTAGQREALLAALAVNPGNRTLLDMLGRVEPGLAVTQLSRLLAAQPPPGDPELRAELAAALLQAQRGGEARALLEELLRANPDDERALQLLYQLDPQLAIARLEQRLPSSSDPAEARELLMNFLLEQGDVAGAEATLERLAHEGQPLQPEEWGMLAEQWFAGAESARGVAALQKALALEHGDPDSWVNELAEWAPAELLATLERRVAGDEAQNDEYWGSLADAYWAAGRHTEARAAWERAFALDASDGEWPLRLNALRDGRDPYE